MTTQKQDSKTDSIWLSWTSIMLGGMLVIFLLVLSISTLDRLKRTSELMLDSLALKGNLVVEYLESATRASLRGGQARVGMLSEMAQEIYNQAQLLSLTIVDQQGRVLVTFSRGSVTPQSLLAHVSETEWSALRESGYFTVSISGSLLLGRNFEPFRQRWWPELSSSPDMSGHHAFRRDAHERAGNRTVLPEQDESYAGASSATTVKTWEGLARLCAYLINQPAKLYALVEMSNHEIYQQIQRDMRNTIMLAVMIFVGCVVLAILLTWLVRNRNLEMQNMRRVVAQNKHLAAVGNLAGTIAHEVRNPLSSLRGLVQLIAKNLPEDSKEVEYAKVAVDEVQRLERVVSGLLNYTRPRTPRFVVLDFAETIRSVLQLVQDDNKAREVKLHLIMADTLPFIEADPDLLRQVLLNLIINALEAINGAGNIWISAEAADEGFVLIKIKDDGPGLPKKEDVFDPFFSTKAQGGGLGLAIAQQIVKSHQGCCLTARNSEDGGAIFELKLKAIHEQ